MKCLLKAVIFIFLSYLLTAFIAGNHISEATRNRAADHARKALEYCRLHGMRTDVCFLVDFDVHSGQDRFFIYDFDKQEIVYSTTCEHGRGGNSTLMKPEFSNVPGSKCTSLGRYAVKEYSHMHNYKFVPCFRLDGLDKSNSNARMRGILIHPNFSQFPTWPLPLLFRTEGCFGMSLRAFCVIKEHKATSSKPVLLWAYK